MATVAEMPTVEAVEFIEEIVPSEDRVDQDMLYEVVDGRIVEKKVGVREIRVAGRLGRLLGNHVDQLRLGTVDVEMFFQLDPNSRTKRRPDVTFVSADRWPLDLPTPETDAWLIVPDLAVEVISPTEVAVEMMAKMREYFDRGVGRVWLVFPTERWIYDYASPTSVRIFAIGDEIDGGDLIPGFRMPLTSLFGVQATGAGPTTP